jgi:hypothetical protein
MNYMVDRIPEQVRIDPDAGGRAAQAGEAGGKQDSRDSVTISDDARRRSGGESGGPGEGAP